MNAEVVQQIEELMQCRKNYKQGEYGELTNEQFAKRMSERFNNLAENFPTIFEKTVSGFFENPQELSRLKMAMGLITRTRDGAISKEDGEKEFGQHLVDVYVKPTLDKNGIKPDGKPQ